MPSREQLETALRNADSAGDDQAATQLANALRDFQEPIQQPTEAITGQPREQPFGYSETLAEVPGAGVAQELASAINRGVVDVAEFFTTDQINAVLAATGSETRVPGLGELPGVSRAIAGGGMEPGLAQDIVRTGGEMIGPGGAVGGAVRGVAGAIPKVLPGLQTAGRTVAQSLGAGTVGADIGLSAVSGAGAEIGEEVGGEEGALIGSFLAPVSAGALGGLLKAGGSGIRSLMKSVEGMSDEGASTLLAEAMVREGLSPDDIAKQMANLGPEALPADMGVNFSRLLRTASNKVPRIEGQAAEVLGTRQAGQGNRLLSALDDATGTSSLTVDDEIARLDKVMSPQIKAMYEAAGEQPMQMTAKLTGLLEGESSVGRARIAAELRLADKRAAGDTITNIDIVNATKQELDDQIGVALRQGENNKVRDLVRLKNIMVDEADKAIPEYKEARNLFAGKAALENAAESGQMFFKMKPGDMQNITKSMGESEKRMFKLGAKQAVLDKIDSMQTTADATKRLFGRGGDVKKLRSLFDTKEEFKQFSDTLKREADFTLTRRAAQANSTTAKQIADSGSAGQALNDAAQLISSPVGATNVLGKVLGGLQAKKGTQAYTKALEDVGDILLTKGMDPTKLQAMLRRGTAKQIEQVFRNAIKPELTAPRVAPIATGVTAELRGAP